MLHLIPAPLHRALYRVADQVRRLWWRVHRPTRSSAIAVIFDEAGRVLLVRHSYGPRVWSLPGGGVGRREDPRAAAIREVREELGGELLDLVEIGRREELDSGSRDMRHVYAARLSGEPVADQREIVAVQWFEPSALPSDTVGVARRLVGEATAVRLEQR